MTASIVTAVIVLKIVDGFLCSYKAIIGEIVTNNHPINKLYFKDHWSYTKTVDTFKVMLDDTRADFVCGLPYQLSIQEGLLFPEDVESDMLESDFNEIKWSMEMEADFFGDDGDAFFDYNSISKNRRIQYPMLPERLASVLGHPKSMRIPPKQPGEMRILSADIALMSSKKQNNDASAIFINQMLPTKAGRYISNIVYTESSEGLRTDAQALVIRKLFDEFQCDYIVLDTNGVGLGVFDELCHDIPDPDSGEIYPALSCCNDPTMAERCTNKDAEKVIWSMKATNKVNSDCAVLLRDGFRNGRLRLLVTEYDAGELLDGVEEFRKLSPQQQEVVKLPYTNTTLLINELVNLQSETTPAGVRVYEKTGMRKDRYSSLSYNFYVATQLEAKQTRRRRSQEEPTSFFLYRAPKIK